MDIKKVFLDTNIVLDIIDSTRKNHKFALEVVRYLLLNDYTIVISEDMLSTIFYISIQKKDALLFVKEVILIDWQIVSFGEDVIRTAINLSIEKNLDLEDLLQCLCAKENSCDVLITNDKKFFDCGVSIYTTENFLEKCTKA